MASTLSRFRDRIEDDLEAQVARLTREVSRLKRSAGGRGTHYYHGARDGMTDLYEELFERMADVLPVIRKRARRVNRAARDNPAMVGLAGLALLGIVAAILYRR